MAGERQHYLPQFLQRGFADDAGLVWLFRKNEPGLRVSTRNVGVERTFYTNENDVHVDHAMTTAEAEFSRTIRALRSSKPGPVAPGPLPEFFAHLEVRSRHLRESFQKASESLYRKTLPILRDTNKLERLLGGDIARNPEKIELMMREELKKRGLPASSSGAVIKELTDRLPEFLREMGPELERAETNVLNALHHTLRTSIKGAHNKALGQAIAPELRVQNYQKLNFRTEDVSEGDMILGDCAAIFHVEGPKPFKAITEKSDTILATILPIAPTRLLVGAAGGYEINPPDIRSTIARCSLEFFIASKDSEENASLAKLVGLDAELLTDEEIQAIVEDASS